MASRSGPKLLAKGPLSLHHISFDGQDVILNFIQPRSTCNIAHI